MANAAHLAAQRPLRILAMGFPGTAKTGSLAALLNAGYKIRLLMFDKAANAEPLYQYTKPEFLKNLDVVAFEDELAGTATTPLQPKGAPKAYARALAQLNDWKTTDENGAEISLGNAADWGNDTFLVIDSLTALGEAAMRRTLSLQSRSVFNRRIQDWGTAAAEQQGFVELVTSNAVKCNVIVTSHLKVIAPKEVAPGDEKNVGAEAAALNLELRQRAAEIIPTKLFPSALGQGLPMSIAQFFPVALLYETVFVGEKEKRIIRTQPSPAVDVKLPASLPATLPVDTGLLTIVQSLTKNGGKA